MRQFKLFISYCHDDVQPRPHYNDSRVGRILADVKHDLGCHSSRSPFKILRDVEITTVSEVFPEKLQAAMSACDMAIIFLSPRYFASDWCLDELDRLHELDKPFCLIDTEPVWMEYNDRVRNHRKAVRDILSVDFWEVDADQKTVLFGYPLPDIDRVNTEKYWARIQWVVEGVKARAKQLFAGDEAEQDNDRRYSVFLACATSDVSREAAALSDSLEAAGHSVLAFDPELHVRDPQVFNQVVSKLLGKCDVYVQLIGGVDKILRGSELRLVRSQYDLAMQSGKPRYIWQKSNFDINKCQPEYRGFLQKIGLDCHAGNYLEFEDYLSKKLDDIRAQSRSEDRRAQRAQAAGANAVQPFVAIDAVAEDRDLAAKIDDALNQYVNIDHLPYDNLTLQMLNDAVADHNGLILAYGKSANGQNWVRSHLKIIRRSEASIRSKKLELAVGNGAPPDAPPCPHGPDVHVIAVADEVVDSVAISQFLDRLGVSVSPGNGAG
jgi:hypothetical protein